MHRHSFLSASRQRLVRLMQQINFGCVENLVIRAGEPVWDAAPKAVREIKFGSDNGARPEAGTRDFVLKNEVVELFRCLDDMGDGNIAKLEIKHGLPFRLIVEEVLA